MVKPSSKGGLNLRKRRKIGGEENFVDRISALPDEILVIILSGLPVRDAQATSILSRRWRYMWASITTLNFDDEKNLCRLYELSRIYPEGKELKKLRYVDWVDSVLKLHRAPNIEQFRVSFDIGPRSSIDEWIQFAMKKGVQMLELDFLEYPAHSRSSSYALRQNVLGIRKGSGLNPLCSDVPSEHISEYVGFKSLKVLDLKSVDVAGNVLEDILSNCSVLERLSMSDSSKLVNLRVISPSTALKYLVIQRCYKIKRIEISDANLVSFVYDTDEAFIYDADEVDLLLNNLPLLVEVSLGGIHSLDFLEVFSRISCCLAQLEILNLNNLSLSYKSESVFPTLSNLKHLELAFDEKDNGGLLQLASFIKASPLLHTLVLQLNCISLSLITKGPFPNKKAAKCSHDNLKCLSWALPYKS
ncbi:F-box protein At4g09920-like isoform X2 [Rosa rugosa]|uniref:F-box protein At4g09920-like isoform X2 n=1 Tax=Rosa rugosa TaxID=74645 RepID=UPI002B413CF0|nr:F-box protein At4g09920-like isoform X2 [Rosa rugosa]